MQTPMSLPEDREFTDLLRESKILIVDDTPLNIRVLADYLEELGFRIFIAQSGEAALERIPQIQPDLILLDVMMPGLDGLEVCRRLKADADAREIPVIFLTALTEIEHKIRGFEMGAVDYITKPFQQKEVIVRVKTHLRIQQLTRSLQRQAAILARRATQLETSSQVGHQITSILQLEQLLQAVVDLIQRTFDYYFVGIWLATSSGKKLRIGAGASRSSWRGSMASEIAVSTACIVSTVYQTKHWYLAHDARSDPQYAAAPSLPETRSELAFPLQVGPEMLGVLDIQSDRVAAFDDEDRSVLQSLAAQVAVAIHNAQLYSDLQCAFQQLEQLSFTDPLTGLRNRRYVSRFIKDFIANVHREYRKARKRQPSQFPPHDDVLFFIFDIDHFKEVNDTYGHEAGDRVLAQLREIFEAVCREADVLIRWGGEEFLLIARYTNRQYAPQLAERLRNITATHAFDIGQATPLHVTCSIGFACYPFLQAHDEAVHWEQVVTLADFALYAAKLSGRNTWVGLFGTPLTPSDLLMQRIRAEVRDMLATGALHVVSSLPEPGQIIWPV